MGSGIVGVGIIVGSNIFKKGFTRISGAASVGLYWVFISVVIGWKFLETETLQPRRSMQRWKGHELAHE